MLGLPSGTPSPGVSCAGNCSSEAQTHCVTLNCLWALIHIQAHGGSCWWLGLSWVQLFALQHRQLCPPSRCLRAQLHTCFPPSGPGAENKRTPTHQGHYLDGGGKKNCRKEGREEKLKGIQGLNQHSLIQISWIMGFFYICASQYDSQQNMWLLST